MSPTLDLDELHLAHGAHEPDSGQMCAMEAVAYIAGEPWSDHPECASKVIGAFLRTWNDSLPDDERQQLKQYVPRLVGTAASDEVEDLRAWMCTDWLVRVHTPAWLRLAGLTEQAERLEGLAELRPDTVPSIKPVLDAVREDAHAAWAAAGAAAGAARAAAWAATRAAGDAAWAATRAAAWAAARDAGDAAWDAAGDAAWAAAWTAAGAAGAAGAARAAEDALRPTVETLQESAHQLVDQLITAGQDK